MLKGSETAEQKRKLELMLAGMVSVALLVLTILVTKFAPSYEATPLVVEVSAPITVFPDFASITDIEAKKQQFFDFLQDYVHAKNRGIENSRRQLLSYAEIINAGNTLSGSEKEWLMDLATTYKVKINTENDRLVVEELLLRVDVIPTSLVLAQAANESAWGTSRFALKGNSVFGQWCYQVGCGIVPSRRADGATHEVKKFDSIEESIESYFLNINTYHLYDAFREQRILLRKSGKVLDSILLARGLNQYSQRGASYIDEVQTLIKQNDLKQRDKHWPED